MHWLKRGGPLLGALLLVMALAGWSWAQDAPRISKEEVKAQLGDSQMVILDVRTPGDYNLSKNRIKGSVRRDPSQFDAWAKGLDPKKTYVLYCS